MKRVNLSITEITWLCNAIESKLTEIEEELKELKGLNSFEEIINLSKENYEALQKKLIKKRGF